MDQTYESEDHMSTEKLQGTEKFEAWAKVELFGHVQLAGRVSNDHPLNGGTLIRLDIPQADGTFYTRLIGQSAVYSISFCEEAIARALAERLDAKPVYSYELSRPQLAGPVDEDDEDFPA